MKKLTKKVIYISMANALLIPTSTHAHPGEMMYPSGMMYHDGPYHSSPNYLASQLGLTSVFLFILFWVVVSSLLAFWLAMLIDITQRDWKNEGDRTAYLVLVIFLNILGAAIYFFIVKKHLDKK